MNNTLVSIWCELKEFWKQLFAVFALNVLARGQSLFGPMYSIDSYVSQINRHPDISFISFFNQGRFGLAALLWLADRIGFYGVDAAVGSDLISIAIFILSGAIMSKIIFENITKSEMLLFCSLFTVHPYMTEFFHFSDATFAVAIATILAAFGSKLLLGSPQQIVGGVLIVAAAMSIYQTVVAFLLALAFLAVARVLAEPRCEESTRATRLAINRVGLLLLSILIYLTAAKCFSWYAGVILDARTDPASLLDVSAKAKVFAHAITLSFLPQSAILTNSVITLMIALLSACFLILLGRTLLSGGILRAFICVIVTGIALVLAADMTSMGSIVWIVPCILTPIAAFEAGLVVIGWHFSSRLGRRGISIALAIVLIGFIGGSNRMLRDQWRVNLADVQQVGRIIGRLELNDNFHAIRTVVITGEAYGRTEPISTQWGDLNTPAIIASDSQIGLIEVATGYTFEKPSTADRLMAKNHCSTQSRWPAQTSVSIVGDIGVVCF